MVCFFHPERARAGQLRLRGPGTQTDLPLRQDAVQLRTAHCRMRHRHTGKQKFSCVFGCTSTVVFCGLNV